MLWTSARGDWGVWNPCEGTEPLVVARIPGVNVPVCVFTSVAKGVLKSAHSGGERLCVRKTACVSETPCMEETASVSKKVCVTETPCVSGVVASVPKCVLPGTPCVDEAPCKEEAPCVKETPCVSGVVAGVPKCVLPSTPGVDEAPCVSGTTCASEMACVSERPCVRETACVRSLYEREMTVGMREHATACPGVNVMTWCVSVVTRRSAWIECRRRRRQMRDKSRVAAVAVLGTATGLHGSEREVWAVLGTRPPRARLRE